MSICNIKTITINNATYNEEIDYLPEPESLATDCNADCNRTISDALPIGTEGVSITPNNGRTQIGNIIINEPGIFVLENPDNNSISFVSSCGIDLINLQN